MAVVTDIPFALCGKLRVEWRVGESPGGIVVSYGRGWGERRKQPVRIVVSYGRSGRKGGVARKDSGELRAEWEEGGSRP